MIPLFLGALLALRAFDASSFSGIIDGMDATVARDGIRIKNAQGVTIRNFNLRHRPEASVSPDLPEGIAIYAGSNVQIVNGTVSGFQMILPADRYWNGDGIAIEKLVDGVTIKGVAANDNTDAGFDIKSRVVMDNVSASGNCRQFRLWDDATIGKMAVGDTTYRGGINGCMGVHIVGNSLKRPAIKINRLTVRFSKPTQILGVEEGPADVTIASCDIVAPPGVDRYKLYAGSKLTLGPGC